MLFHQLVENAFKHGIDPAPGKSELVIRAELTEGELFLSVSNTGILKTQSPDSMGLRFIREQLLSLYGKAASFTIQQVERNRVLALVTIPAKEALIKSHEGR
jgi:LytS/YehU family sensor histidine kinase